MIDRRTIFEIHRLYDQGFSRREIASQLRMDRATIAKYIRHPETTPARKKMKSSKLDPYRDCIHDMVEQYPAIKAPVVLQRIKAKGFAGEITIVRNLLRELRGEGSQKEAFIRFESESGHQIQVDWGHFHSLSYDNATRKLYALAVVESHSRMLYVSFSHSQRQECLHQGLLDAFRYFGGCAGEIVVDNMMTAVTERVLALKLF